MSALGGWDLSLQHVGCSVVVARGLSCHKTCWILVPRKWKCQLLSCVWLFATPWTAAHQAPLSVDVTRQEYWSGLPFPSPGVLPNPRIKPGTSALQAGFSLPRSPGSTPVAPALAGGFFITGPPRKSLHQWFSSNILGKQPCPLTQTCSFPLPRSPDTYTHRPSITSDHIYFVILCIWGFS